MSPTVEPLDPSGPGLLDWCSIYAEGRTLDSGTTMLPQEQAAWLATHPTRPDIIRFAATDGGRVVGAAECRMATGDPTDTPAAFARLYVAAHARRGGAGRALATAATTWAAEHGCPVLRATVIDESPGAAFATALGARVDLRLTVLQLQLDGPAEPVTAPADTITCIHWTGGAPDALVGAYAHTKSMIADAPGAALQMEAPPWTPARIRHWERGIADNDHELWVSAAVAADGTIIALTEVEVPPASGDASQQDTVVAAGHRGRGLATWLKQDLANRLRTLRPDVDRITTTINADNAPMLHIADRLGYRPTHRRLLVSLPVPGR